MHYRTFNSSVILKWESLVPKQAGNLFADRHQTTYQWGRAHVYNELVSTCFP